MNVSYVAFDAKEKAVLHRAEFSPDLAPHQVLVKADFDLISAGTELANYHMLPNTVTAENGFPIQTGYSVSGHVVEIGSEVKTLQVGDNVVVSWRGHRSWFICEENVLFKIPKGIDQKDAAFAHLCSFSLLGVRKLNLQLGEAVMIAGQGVLGLLAAQIARLSGASPVLVCDFSPERRALALQLGADYALDPRESGFVEHVKKLTDGRGPEGVVEVTGYISALQQALEYIAWEGRISLLGCTRISDQTIDFYKYVHRRGISLIGSHTFARPQSDSRPGEWTEFDDYRTFFKLIKAGKLQVEPIITRIVSPRDTAAVYAEIGGEKNPPFGILFDWRDFE